MKLKINKYNNEAYKFAEAYLQRFRGQPYDTSNVLFDFELMRGDYDNREFDMVANAFNWPHLMVAERYVNKNAWIQHPSFDRESNVRMFHGELGPQTQSLFNKFSRKGGGTKRRGRRRARRTPSLKKGTSSH